MGFADTNKNTNKFFMLGFFLWSFGFCQYHNSLMLPCKGRLNLMHPFAIKGGLNLKPPLAKPRLKPNTN